MNDKLNAVLNLLDDQDTQTTEAIDFLLSDERARQVWSSAYDVKLAIADKEAVLASEGFADKVFSLLEDEPTFIAQTKIDIGDQQPSLFSKLLKPVAGLSIAASVAVVTVFGVNQTSSLNVGGVVAESQQPDQAVVTVADFKEVKKPVADTAKVQVVPVMFTGNYDPRTYWQGSDNQTSENLNEYLATHLEYASPVGLGEVAPYAQVVGYDE